MAKTTASSATTLLAKKITHLLNASSERDMYPYIRDLLTMAPFGVGLKPEQIVVDSAISGTQDAPDLIVYTTKGGKVLRSPDHAYAVFEVKPGTPLSKHADSIYKEKLKYIQPGSRFFFLMDQKQVIRKDLLDKTEVSFLWLDMAAPEQFLECFTVLSFDRLRLEEQLEQFRDNKTPFAYQFVDKIGRSYFIETIREVSEILTEAVARLIDVKVVPDLKAANEILARMTENWGQPEYDWDSLTFPVEFKALTDEESSKELTHTQIESYEAEHDEFASEVDPYLYALRIEHHLLQSYARQMGFDEEPSLLKPRKTKNRLTDSGKAVESFSYQTASLIVSRMLMVRFSEDHGFLKRYISNGGVEVFAKYAKYYNKPMQSLLQETYRQSRDLYRNLFDQNILDWALDSDDAILSEALLHSMYLLSRWDFKTVHGDILAGVYDRYLDTAKRRALGEVFTRPEIARYMLEACEYSSKKTVLDPACGTGTFLVEALSQDVKRLRSMGALNEKTLVPTLRRLHGLDISPFSVALAQIQILWHIIDLFAGKSTEETRKLARAVVPAMMVHGGQSSLDVLGRAFEVEQQHGLDFAVERSAERRKRVAAVPRRFRQISQGQYDIVIGNPPYVRTHRQIMDEETRKAYEAVAHGQTDLYIPFFYRALRSWAKDDGKVALVVPIAILDAAYAAPLRRLIATLRIREIVDLESLRKKTFRGIKRPTVILVLDKSKATDSDAVTSTLVPADAYDSLNDVIDFSKAQKSAVVRTDLLQTSYLPPQDTEPWRADLDYASSAALLPKMLATDVAPLKKLSHAARLGDILKVAYVKRSGEREIAEEIPAGESPKKWEPYLMLAYGLKLGGGSGLKKSGIPIYKGQNIFPGRLLGEPMGFWHPEKSEIDSERLYAYRELFDYSCLYAIRNISQLPTAILHPKNVVFQNTAQLIQLKERFPLNIYLLSRIPQWYSAKLLRSSIIEDLTCTWVKKNLLLIPIPAIRGKQWCTALEEAGELLWQRDRDLANADRKVEAILAESKTRTMFDLIASGDSRTDGLDLAALQSGELPLAGVRENGKELIGDDLLFHIPIPDAQLRKFLEYTMQRLIKEDAEIAIDVASFGNLKVPDDLGPVVKEIEQIKGSDAEEAFEQALIQVDQLIAQAFGLTSAEASYIIAQMKTDSFLKQLRPMYEQRGFREQPYSDHSGSDRYN